MKISRRRKHNKRSKYTKRVTYTRHTKHGGGKHYKHKRTYRKHPRKLKHKSRLQRGGVKTETEKKFYTVILDPEDFPSDAMYLFNISYVELITETKLSLYFQDLNYYDKPSRGIPELLLNVIENPEIRRPITEFSCDIELVSVRATNYNIPDKPSKHTYKFKLSFYTGGKLRRENCSITYLELSLVFDVAWKTQLNTDKETSPNANLPALPDLPALPAIQAIPAPDIPENHSGGDGPGIVVDDEFMIELGLRGLLGYDIEHGIQNGILTQHLTDKQIKNKYFFFPFKAVRSMWDAKSQSQVNVNIDNHAAFQTIIDIMKILIQSAEERINGIYM
jgi:hypothetical protein